MLANIKVHIYKIPIYQRISAQLKKIGKLKTAWYFSILGVSLISLCLCLWGAIQVTLIQTKYFDDINSLISQDPTLVILRTKYQELVADGIWEMKGYEGFSWYLASKDSLGSICYWFAGVFGLVSAPLIIFYCASFLIVALPKKSRHKDPELQINEATIDDVQTLLKRGE